ncbi:MAG: alpha-glucosidase C-terminal domain-containing protein [Oscillospiraceae bacterium]|nr:alpha-glucosidase C-terminal domain-containing protein [Oscillospiraceae bacterium]
MSQPVYNSRDLRYKSPYGAVPSGTKVRFTLRPQRALGFSRGWLTARFEMRGDETVTVPMRWEDSELGIDVFSGELDTGDYVGLVWYSFVLEGLDGRRQEVGEHQLTVYDGAQTVPDWFGQGVTYQIFPDRFFRTRIPDPAGMVGGRTVHQSWDEEPEYRPDEKGEVRNRDFFGGDLAGITQKLDYLKSLGVETVYLCPIFEAAENHRYGTADYSRVDPMLGTNEDFRTLCDQLHSRGMRLMLDGVFNHTGFVSRYFNGDGFYPEMGACQSEDSPYRSWFDFKKWPDEYESWWGIYSLPAVNENDPAYRNFIFDSEDSVVRRWLRAGADGWRLDVADELPDDFVHGIHAAARAEKPHAVVIGEVWEDGTTKVAYGVRRRHLLGGHCDGLMNYPFRTALLDWLRGGDAQSFMEQMETLRENYPPFAFYSAMNALGTHDTLRVLTLLGAGDEKKDESKDWRAAHRMTREERERGLALLRLGAAVLFCFPGSPTVYYGDEAGMEGFEDPFNRRTFPWGSEDRELTDWFAALGNLRKKKPALRRGDIRWLAARDGLLAFVRETEGEHVLCACNAGEKPAKFALDKRPRVLLGEGLWEDGTIELPPRTTVIATV